MKRYSTRFYLREGIVLEFYQQSLRNMWRTIRKFHGINAVLYWEVIE